MDDGAPFAELDGDIFKMADGSVARLGGTVVFMRDPKGEELAAFWLERNVG